VAITQRDLIKLVEEAGLAYADGPEGTLLFRVEAEGEQLNMVLDRPSEGKIVQFRTLNMLNAPAGGHRPVLLRALATSNDRLKLVKFAIDPDDGEVCAYIDVVLGDGRLTGGQFTRCVQALQQLVIRAMVRFRKILATGDDPGLSTGLGPGSVEATVDQLMSGATKAVNKAAGGNGHGGNGHSYKVVQDDKPKN